jgi:hypothetical protein
MELKKISDDISVIYDNGKIIKCDEIPITHDFADQVYLRQMNMSKDQLVVGAFHNHKHVWFLMTGRVSIKSNEEVIEHVAPCCTQRFIYAHEDSVFINIHKNPDNITDIEELEKTIVSLNKEEYEKQKI